jgi:hypothetical protein
MPSSRPHTIPTVIHLLRQIKPRSILDVGVGFGKWGHLFREYTDILAAEKDPPRYQRENWQVRIDGIEGHAAYLTEMHRFLYNHIHIGNACAILPELPPYDLIFMGDVIEHLDKEQGYRLLMDGVAKATRAVIVSTPKEDTGQEDLCGNELERHRSVWSAKDFRGIDGAAVTTIDRATLLAVILKSHISSLSFKPSPLRAADLSRLLVAKRELRRIIPVNDKWILVDEEQIRTDLSHRRIIPFLERNNVYWGPPEDDVTAIAELERLRAGGAKYIAFIWSTFWWLQHYSAFASYLHSNCRCIHSDDYAVVFALNSDLTAAAGGV